MPQADPYADWEEAQHTWAAVWYARWKKDPGEQLGASPAAVYWPRFEARAALGDTTAVLWLLRHLSLTNAASAQRVARGRSLFARVRAAGPAEWIAEAIPLLVAAQGDLGAEAVADYLMVLAFIDEPTARRRAALLGLAELEVDPELAFELSLMAFADRGQVVAVSDLSNELADELAERVEDAVTEASIVYKDRWYIDLGDMLVAKRGAPRDPEAVHQPILEGLAQRGSTRAALWCLWSIRPEDEATKGRLKRYLRLAASAELEPEQMWRLSWNASAFVHMVGLEETESAIDALIARADAPTRARLKYSLAEALCRTAEHQERGLALLHQVVDTWPDSDAASKARGKIFRFENLVIGKLVPEFEALDVDGMGFRLSDYVGRVTVLDFWGFW